MISYRSLIVKKYSVLRPIVSSKYLDDEFYLIGNAWYKYDEEIDDIVKLDKKPVSLAIATYETLYGIVVVNEIEGSVYDYKCRLIESSDVDGILKDYYEGNKSLQLKYPNLKGY